MGRISEFQATETTPPEFEQLSNLSRIGLTRMISMRSGKPLKEVNRLLFQWFAEGKLALERSPTKMLFVSREKELDEETLEEIMAGIEERKAYRLEGFETFAGVVNSEDPMVDSIRKHLGI